MRNILIVAFICCTTIVFSQDNKSEPQVSDTVINSVAISACDCMNKINVSTLVTPEQRMTAMTNCLVQATNENEKVISNDKNAEMQKGHDAGKQYGVVLGRKIVPLLKANCPAFMQLIK